ncbi:MAG: hypothetical protein AMXMBFR58_21700 [Phycisphaerae bacterium]
MSPLCFARRSDQPRTVAARTIGLHIAAAAALLLTGCWSYRPGDDQLPRAAGLGAAADTIEWPSRDLAPAVELLNRTPDVVRYFQPIDGQNPSGLAESDRREMDRFGVKVTYKGIHGLGLLRMYEPLSAPEPKPAAGSLTELINFMTLGFTPNAYWLTSRTLEGTRSDRERTIELPESEAEAPGVVPPPFEFMDAPTLEANSAVPELHLRSGMAIRFPPTTVPRKPYTGVVLHLNAMFGNEYEVRTLDVFRQRGWAVIDLKPTSQILPPVPPQWHGVIRDAARRRSQMIARICTDITGSPRYNATSLDDYRRVAEKFQAHPLASDVEYLSRVIERCRSGAYIASSPDTYPQIAEHVARELDQAQAGSAYACEAVLDYVAKHRPDLAGLPVALIGFSAGGLAAPTSAARIHDQIDAVVIIGGGADCFTASQRSVFSNGGITIRTTADEPMEERPLSLRQIREISRRYLAASKLDPYHTAPRLASLPVLLVTGSDDTWVPAECGDLLWERLGRPPRLEISAGHELLFYFLPDKAHFIAQWVEDNVRRSTRDIPRDFAARPAREEPSDDRGPGVRLPASASPATP